MEKQRILYIDLAKCIAIYLVLWGHVLGSLTSPLISSETLVKGTSNLIYSFHMPLFMFLSGLFASSALKKPLISMLWQKGRQLLWPCITFGFILSFFWYRWNVNLDALKHGPLWYGLFYDYWFLHSLFANFCVAWFVYRLPRKFHVWGFITAEMLICVAFSMGHNLANMATMMPFFFAGIEAKRYLDFVKKHKHWIFMVSMIIFCILFFRYKSDFNSSMYFFQPFSLSKLTELFYRFFIGAAGSMAMLSLCLMLEERYKDKKQFVNVCKIGGGTLYIYILQGVLLECILAHYYKICMNAGIYALVFAPLISLASLVLCQYLTVSIKRISFLDTVLFGNFKRKS